MSMRITSGLSSVVPLENLFPGGRLSHDLHIGLRANYSAQPFPNDAVVVCYEDADGSLQDEVAP
jgi:hypothetical protein